MKSRRLKRAIWSKVIFDDINHNYTQMQIPDAKNRQSKNGRASGKVRRTKPQMRSSQADVHLPVQPAVLDASFKNAVMKFFRDFQFPRTQFCCTFKFMKLTDSFYIKEKEKERNFQS